MEQQPSQKRELLKIQKSKALRKIKNKIYEQRNQNSPLSRKGYGKIKTAFYKIFRS